MSATSPPEMHIVYEAVEGKRKGRRGSGREVQDVGVWELAGGGEVAK